MDDMFDVIVVGAGTGGIPTAIFAGQRGANVLLIEADDRVGGTLHWSSGQMTAAGTKLQKRLGIEDHPDWHWDDCLRISKGEVHPVLTRIAIDHAADSFDWLCDNGLDLVPFAPVAGWGHEPHRVRRYAWGVNGGTSVLEVMQPLLDEQIGRGTVTLSLQTKMTKLLTENGAVVGVEVQARDGGKAEVFGKNVVLATGGYAANPALWKELTPNYPLRSYCNPYSRGEGIIAARSVGARVDGGDRFLCSTGGILQNPNDPLSARGGLILNPHFRQPWEIFVNHKGERFMREDHPSVDNREHALLKQKNVEMWVVFDEGIRQNAPNFHSEIEREHMKTLFNNHPSYFAADTLDELAKRAGVDAAGLKKTVEEFNQGVEAKKDKLGRESLPRPINRGPYYAIKTVGYAVLSPGGLDIDADFRVLDTKSKPIPNLYATGEVLGKARLSGATYLSGMSVLPAITFGRLLGQTRLKWGDNRAAAE
ncbi:MAG: FAD-dependent oxidoreductase [Alphaproteobacteria bacterium]|nr:FAD-dependent oxidoreductase [Alphaproteobacteria bacterium]